MIKITKANIEKLLRKNVETILSDICEGAGMCVIRILSSDKKHLIAIAIHVVEETEIPQIDIKIPIDGSISGKAITNEEIEEISSIVGDWRFEKQSSLGYKSAMIVPLAFRNSTIGVIQIYTKKPDYIFNDHEKHIAKVVADDLAFLLIILREKEENERLQDEMIKQKSLKELGHGIATIAHHLRNDLTAPMVLAQMILRGEDIDPKVFANSISISIKRALSLIENILAYGKPLVVGKKAINLNNIIKLVVDNNYSALEIIFNLKSSKMIHIDIDKIYAVILEMVKNANDASPNSKIIVGTKDVDGGILLEIENQGEIPHSEKEKIFAPFYTTKGRKGTGLGLPFVLNVIQGHHGSLSFESVNGKTIFTVSLPE
ncbi:GAF domain-containing sensor histidine kinase [Candidatus Wolfebacteria bacterium]|nr:GAF domain-containing sensor histidine kinase [Candidatus Wolfebacteria bacterium]